jgi:hypothetical protein
MPRLVDWFLGRPNNKEDIDLPYLHSNYSSSAQGQMCDKLHQKAAIIAVSIAGVQIISSEIVRGLRNLTKGKVINKGKRPLMQVQQGQINFTTLGTSGRSPCHVGYVLYPSPTSCYII